MPEQDPEGSPHQVNQGYDRYELSPQAAPPSRLLHLIRQYWQIENRLHWRRDITLDEDACTVSRGQTPRVLATLNNVTLPWSTESAS